MPEKVRNAPNLFPWLYDTYEAFFELLSCLSAEGRIPWTAITEYAAVMSMAETESELASFVGLIRAMEKAYSDYRKTEQEKADKASKKKGKGPKNGNS